MKMSLGLTISSVVTQVARLTRDLWTSINDTWTNEQRKWQDII